MLKTADLQERLSSANLVTSNNVKTKSEQSSQLLSMHCQGQRLQGDGGTRPPQHFGWGDAKVNVPPTDCPFSKIFRTFHLDKLDYCISGVTGVSMHCFPHI